MLNTIFKKVILAPAFIAGAFVFSDAIAQSNPRPNIQNLTSESASKQVPVDNSAASRIPADLNKHYFGIGLGQTLLMGDFKDSGIDKITPDLYYNYSASYSFDFMANFHYSRHSYKDKKAEIPGLALSIKGKVYQYDAFSPFVLGGLGFYMPKISHINADGIRQKSTQRVVLGLNLGFGGELRLNEQVTIGVIGHYHDPFDVRQETSSDVEGSYFKLLILGMFSFN